MPEMSSFLLKLSLSYLKTQNFNCVDKTPQIILVWLSSENEINLLSTNIPLEILGDFVSFKNFQQKAVLKHRWKTKVGIYFVFNVAALFFLLAITVSPLRTNEFRSESVFVVQFVHKSNKVSLGTQLTQLATKYCTVVGL